MHSSPPAMPDIDDSERTPLVNALLEIIAWQETQIGQLERELIKFEDIITPKEQPNVQQSDTHFVPGETPVYLFLDIDGVLVQEDKPDETVDLDEDLQKLNTQCAEKFETLIRQYDNVKIVISSSWREIFTLETIKASFSPDVAQKIVGITPIRKNPIQYYRYQEILDYLRQENLQEIHWVAIDDIVAHFPSTAPLIMTDPFVGFNDEVAQKLAYFLATGKCPLK